MRASNTSSTSAIIYEFDLDGLAQRQNLDILRKAFTDPEALRPGQTAESITRQAAEQFGQLSDRLRQRGIPAERAAHFLMKIIFCMFAEDIRLLPDKLFSKLLTSGKKDPARLTALLEGLFAAMSTGGDFGVEPIPYFNGGLFDDSDVIEFRTDEVESVIRLNDFDWSDVEPSIFGTLFERTLDPDKRSQIGAHYTSREDILTLLEPVVMAPIRRRWDEVKAECDKIWSKRQSGKVTKGTRTKRQKRIDKSLRDFVEELAHYRVLDPACGSGNFLYVAINLLLDLEKEVIAYAATREISLLPHVRPTQLLGIEINPYAQQLAQVVIWIGYLQWKHHNGFQAPRDPVLEPIESIRRMDAILDLSDPENPKEPEWPEADFIVGNPPFLGGKLLRSNLGDGYVDAMFKVWGERTRLEADLCCYWFEKAASQIGTGNCWRAGLLATQGIRGGANRETLNRVKRRGDIFFAESDREWVLDGANVHVSMVGFDSGEDRSRMLDGKCVSNITTSLTATSDIQTAKRLLSNRSLAFMGVTKQGPFDVSERQVEGWLSSGNPSGRPNSDVLRIYLNGMDITKRPRNSFLIDFPHGISQEEASRYELPFEYLKSTVQPFRAARTRNWFRESWWELYAPRPAMRLALRNSERYLVTPRVAKHRLFVWLDTVVLPDCQLFAFARSDDYFFGLVHSRIHEVWARSQGTQVRERESGFRYTPTSCFETFPFPEATDAQPDAISEAAKELDRLRSNWLNPPEWTRTEVLEFPGSVDGPWKRYVDPATVDERGIGTVRYPRLAPRNEECAKQLKKRTLTNLYNQRPTWLALVHRRLDEAVFEAYGWPPDLSDDDLLARLLERNLATDTQTAGTAGNRSR